MRKIIHFIRFGYGTNCGQACRGYYGVIPIEYIPQDTGIYPKGTFNPKKVTCKSCLKTKFYKDALQKQQDMENYPLFFLGEQQ